MNEVKQWLDNPSRTYEDGVRLFALHCPNKMLVRYFQSGVPRYRMEKLVYEMGKLVRTSAHVRQSPTASVLPPAPVKAPKAAVKPQKQDVIPEFIMAAKKEISSLYTLIDKGHTALYELGTSNREEVVRARKRLLDARKPTIERADILYTLKEEWFSTKDAAYRKEVEKSIRAMLSASAELQPSIEQPNPASEVAGLTDLQLSKRLRQLRSSVTKTNNMLRYQSIRKGSEPTPMPEGPKRDEYEKKLEELKVELDAVRAELERRGNE